MRALADQMSGPDEMPAGGHEDDSPFGTGAGAGHGQNGEGEEGVEMMNIVQMLINEALSILCDQAGADDGDNQNERVDILSMSRALDRLGQVLLLLQEQDGYYNLAHADEDGDYSSNPSNPSITINVNVDPTGGINIMDRFPFPFSFSFPW